MILFMNWFNLECFITTVGDDETQASDAKAVMEALALGPVNASLFSTSAGDCGQVGGPMCGAGGRADVWGRGRADVWGRWEGA